jgi:hypothetical protein
LFKIAFLEKEIGSKPITLYLKNCILTIMQINLDDVEYITETSLTIRGTRRRTTVPKEIVDHFSFEDGDRIRWILFKDGKILVIPKEKG